ncbi:MAG TPA: hypothetical protein VIK78_01530 [Ruminiclostridium sp.]
MANYPEWVMKFKEKGTYINYANGKYYLYAAHSERVPGTKKVNRISDGYLGRITQEMGFVPPKDKVTGTIEVFEYGLSSTILFLCKHIHLGFRRNFKANADFIMVSSILFYIYGQANHELFHQSFLFLRYTDLDLSKTPTPKQSTAIERGVLMIKDNLTSLFGDDTGDIVLHFPHVYKVRVNKRLYESEISDKVNYFKQKYHIEWED